jgi:hypothetical protein
MIEQRSALSSSKEVSNSKKASNEALALSSLLFIIGRMSYF